MHATPARLPFFSGLSTESTPGRSPMALGLSPVAEALKPTTDAPPAQVHTDVQPQITAPPPEQASAAAASVVEEACLVLSAPVEALNADAPVFKPTVTASADVKPAEPTTKLRVTAAEFVPSQPPSRCASPEPQQQLPSTAALMPPPPPVDTEVLRAQLLRLARENEAVKAQQIELHARLTRAEAAAAAAVQEAAQQKLACAAVRQQQLTMREKLTSAHDANRELLALRDELLAQVHELRAARRSDAAKIAEVAALRRSRDEAVAAEMRAHQEVASLTTSMQMVQAEALAMRARLDERPALAASAGVTAAPPPPPPPPPSAPLQQQQQQPAVPDQAAPVEDEDDNNVQVDAPKAGPARTRGSRGGRGRGSGKEKRARQAEAMAMQGVKENASSNDADWRSGWQLRAALDHLKTTEVARGPYVRA